MTHQQLRNLCGLVILAALVGLVLGGVAVCLGRLV